MSVLSTKIRTRLFCKALSCSGAQRYLERRAIGGAVVAYHGVVERLSGSPLDVYNVEVDTFETHVKFFCKCCNVVPLSRIVQRIGRGEAIPSDWVAITMDDALRNQVTLAAEVLRAHHCPWTLGVPAGLIGTDRTIWTYEVRYLLLKCWRFNSVPSPVNPAASLSTSSDVERRATAQRIHQLLMTVVDDRRRDEYIDRLIDQFGRKEFFEGLAVDGRFVLADWEQLRRMQAEGVELASHGWKHRPQNATICQESAAEEVVASRKCMNAQLGQLPAGFVLPGGQIGAETTGLIQSAGYEYCLTTEPRRVGTSATAMRIPRFDAEFPLAVLRRHMLKQ